MKTTRTEIEAIRQELVEHGLSYRRGIELRAFLSVHGAEYKSKNTPAQVLAFIKKNGHGLQLLKTHPQDPKVPYVWQLFTPKSQWVCGDSVAECFDKAIAVKADWTHISTTDANALILVHQALKEAKGEDTVQVAEVE